LDADELAKCGLTANQISARTRVGRLHRLYRGVYAVGHRAVSLHGRFLAAVKACRPGAVLSHWSAAVLWGFADRRPAVVDVTIWHGARRRVRGIRIHRTRALRADESTIYDGIPVTTPARTVIDLAAELTDEELRTLLRRAIGLRKINLRQLIREMARAGKRSGMARLRRVIADGVPTKSELEEVVLDLLVDGGFETPDVNVPMLLDRRRVIPDFRWSEQRLVIEADGKDWHDNPIARAADIERQRLLEAHGETVLRVTWKQAVAQPERTRARIAAAGAPLAAP
jgi:hypothetical protein